MLIRQLWICWITLCLGLGSDGQSGSGDGFIIIIPPVITDATTTTTTTDLVDQTPILGTNTAVSTTTSSSEPLTTTATTTTTTITTTTVEPLTTSTATIQTTMTPSATATEAPTTLPQEATTEAPTTLPQEATTELASLPETTASPPNTTSLSATTTSPPTTTTTTTISSTTLPKIPPKPSVTTKFPKPTKPFIRIFPKCTCEFECSNPRIACIGCPVLSFADTRYRESCSNCLRRCYPKEEFISCENYCQRKSICPTPYQIEIKIRSTSPFCRLCVESKCAHKAIRGKYADCLYQARKECWSCTFSSPEVYTRLKCGACLNHCIVGINARGRRGYSRRTFRPQYYLWNRYYHGYRPQYYQNNYRAFW